MKILEVGVSIGLDHARHGLGWIQDRSKLYQSKPNLFTEQINNLIPNMTIVLNK